MEKLQQIRSWVVPGILPRPITIGQDDLSITAYIPLYLLLVGLVRDFVPGRHRGLHAFHHRTVYKRLAVLEYEVWNNAYFQNVADLVISFGS